MFDAQSIFGRAEEETGVGLGEGHYFGVVQVVAIIVACGTRK